VCTKVGWVLRIPQWVEEQLRKGEDHMHCIYSWHVASKKAGPMVSQAVPAEMYKGTLSKCVCMMAIQV
jgi:hypothetical protein